MHHGSFTNFQFDHSKVRASELHSEAYFYTSAHRNLHRLSRYFPALETNKNEEASGRHQDYRGVQRVLSVRQGGPTTHEKPRDFFLVGSGLDTLLVNPEERSRGPLPSCTPLAPSGLNLEITAISEIRASFFGAGRSEMWARLVALDPRGSSLRFLIKTLEMRITYRYVRFLDINIRTVCV